MAPPLPPGAGSSLRSASGRKTTRTLRAAGLDPASEKNARVRTVLGQQGRLDVAARTEEGGSLRSCAQRAARPNRKGVPGATSHSRGRPAGGDPAFPRRREERGLGGPPRVPATPPTAAPARGVGAQYYLLPSQPGPWLPPAPRSEAPAAPPFPLLADFLRVGASVGIGPNLRGGGGAPAARLRSALQAR